MTSTVSQEPMLLKKAPAMMKYRSEWRIASAIYFAIAGSLLISGLSLAAPSQWFVFLAWSFAAQRRRLGLAASRRRRDKCRGRLRPHFPV